MKSELQELIDKSNVIERAEGRAEGQSDGIRLTKEAIRLHDVGKSVAEIAAVLHVSEDLVRMMTA